MSQWGVIGGTGLERLEGWSEGERHELQTPYGLPSSPLQWMHRGERSLLFLSRHGAEHTIPPHRVNYRANLWALRELGVEQVVGVAAVGGITESMAPGVVVVPDQVIDYTWGREQTLYEGPELEHVDFTQPYCESLRQRLLTVAARIGVAAVSRGTYGATQGPRLESAAEILRMERDGCDLVGMTGMPEAGIARELELCYSCCAVSANWAAGKGEGEEITMAAIEENLRDGMAQVREILRHL